jgi:hypothetical protein
MLLGRMISVKKYARCNIHEKEIVTLGTIIQKCLTGYCFTYLPKFVKNLLCDIFCHNSEFFFANPLRQMNILFLALKCSLSNIAGS